jgi:hypothetical protein
VPKKEWQNETSNKSQTPQRVSQENTLQNGHIIKGVKYSENRRLGHISRSTRCLSTCSNISYTSEISLILHSKPVLSIQSPLFRINFSTENLHKNSICSGSIPEDHQMRWDFRCGVTGICTVMLCELGLQKFKRCSWNGLMNRQAFRIICKHEAIMPRRCRNMKADAFSWVKRFSIARFNSTILSWVG